jgi:hypothetical protein
MAHRKTEKNKETNAFLLSAKYRVLYFTGSGI